MAMTSSVIDLAGIERALALSDQSVFDQIVLPSGIDKETLKDAIILRAGSFELLYSDPIMLTVGIRIWSKKMYPTFEKWIQALNVEYNLLDNYDRHEEITEEHEGTFNGKTSSENNSQGNSKSKVENDDTTTATGDTTGFNSSDFVDNDQNVTVLDGEQNSSSEYKDKTTGSGTQDNTDKYKNKHNAHLWGNIGTTTSQMMLESELSLRGKYNIYDMISDLFISEFCIMTF